jgi:hypothetical protein
MLIFKSKQLPELATRSPFATATLNPALLLNLIPTHAAASESTKLWVDPESSSARRTAPWTVTYTCIVLPLRGCMPVSAAMDIVSSSL